MLLRRMSGPRETGLLGVLVVIIGLCLSGYVKGDYGGFDGGGLNRSPIFLEEPLKKYFVVKNRPAKITCKALGAGHISFKCAGSFIKDHDHTNKLSIDPLTKKAVLETSITVTKEEVAEYYGSAGYWCECYASNKKKQTPGEHITQSKRGIVEVAFLKKKFVTDPYDTKVELEQTVTIYCLPPAGSPLPKVMWFKEGQEVPVDTDYNLIISSEGNLIINQARLNDAGNYTCGAQNVVARRLSKPVKLIVFINGGWSTWSQWTACSASCGRGMQKRQRTCSNPAPKDGGLNCVGEPIQKESCNSICPVDGDWGPWSSWSTCNTDCSHLRRRTCDSPRPANGGKYCFGFDLDTQNCTNGMCRDGSVIVSKSRGTTPKPTTIAYDNAKDQEKVIKKVSSGPSDVEPSRQEASEAKNNEDIALYIGVCVAIAVTIIVVVIIIIVVRRRNSPQQNTRDRDGLPNGDVHSHLHSGEEKKVKNDNLLSAYQPDLTQVMAVQPPNPELPNNNHMPHVNSFDKLPPTYAEIKEHRLSVPSVNGVPLTPNSVKMIEHNNMLTHNSSMDQLANKGDKNMVIVPPLGSGSPRVSETDNLMDSRGSMMSAELPSHIDTDAVTWSTFDYRGGRLTLPESGVSLLIPEGAIKKGSTEEIYMAVCRDDKDRPRLSEKQTILSPIVLCGPTGMLLKKPVVLSLQHCANIRQGGWKLSVCSSNTPLEEPPHWQHLVTIGHETINTPVYTQIDATHCHLMAEQLQRYALIGEPIAQGRAVKILRLAAFAPSLPPSMDFSIRVYVVEDTPDALEGVMQVERRLGGRLLDKPKQIPFQDGGHNLCLTIEELGTGWRSKLAANYQEIPFRHIWSGNQNNLHCSFSLEMVERVQDTIRCKIQVYQKAILTNRQVLKINTNFKEPPTCSSPVSNTLKGRSSTVTSATNSSSGVSSVVTLDTSTQASRLPSQIRHQLCMMLDPPCARGNDWRMLAQFLTVDRYINYFATKTSPTEHILDLWEAIHREETAVTDLMNILRVMGRMDCAAVLEKDNGAWL